MPRVPTLTGPSVQLRPLNVPETQAAAEGMGTAIALGTAAETLGGIAEIVNRADRAVVENAEVGFAREVDQLFMNEGQTGFLQQRGVNARDAYQKLGEQFDAAEQKAMEQLNGRQRAIFRETAAKSRVIAMRRADDYLNRELEALEDANSKALTATTLSRITLDAANPASVDGYMTELRERAMRDATRAGLDTTARDALVAEATSTGRFTHIRALANSDRIDEAAAMFERYKDQLTDPQQREQAQNLIEQETLRVRAQREADNIIATAGPDRRKALTAARELTGTLRDNVEQRVEAYYRQQDQLRREEQEASVNAVSAQLEQTGSLNFLRGEQLQAMRQIPGAMQALQARERQLQGGGERETDLTLYTRLVTDAETNPQALVDINPALVQPYLSDSDFRWFVETRAEAMGGNQDNARMAGQMQSNLDDMVFDEARAMDLIQLPGTFANISPKEQRVFNAIRTEARRRIVEEETRGAVSPARRLQIVREVASGMAPQRKTEAAPTTGAAPVDQNIASWSAWISSQGGSPNLSKINRLNQVARRMPPPAYTDADRQAEMIRIAREP